MTQISLSAFGPEGFSVIAALYGKAFDDPWPAPSVRELLSSFGVYAMVATITGQPVGFLLIRTVVDEAEILSIGVVPDYRRLGVADTLLTEGLTEMARRGAASCFLEVGQDNPNAVKLYLKFGFERAGLRKNYYRRSDGTRVDALLMQKKLNHSSNL